MGSAYGKKFCLTFMTIICRSPNHKKGKSYKVCAWLGFLYF